ncbi:MAG: hypothetical protein ACI90V_008405 [Bacillariaceae sp.]|jgi:hypothetical protein
MLCDDNIEADNYHGLDSDRDTEEEVEATLRFFPAVLTRIYADAEDSYPIQFLPSDYDINRLCYIYNLKARSFLSLVARLAKELGPFTEDTRGGLLCQDYSGYNVLQNFIRSDIPKRHKQNREHHELVDGKYLRVLIQLRQMGLLKKEDIKMYNLLMILCYQSEYNYFAEKQFRFLVEWDPTGLLHADDKGLLPLQYAAKLASIRGFQFVFEYGMQ